MIAARNPLPPAQDQAANLPVDRSIPAADPFLALIEAHRAAYLAWDAASGACDDLAPGDAGRAEAERAMHDAGQHHRAAFDALAGTPPTDPVHLVRLTEHLRWFYAEEFDGRGHAGLGLVLGGIEALSPVLTATPIERLSSASAALPLATVTGPDPVLALIEAHRVAYATLDRVARAWTKMDPHDPGYEAAEDATEEPARREREAFGALLAARPVTAAGLWALAAYLPEAARKVSPGPDLDALKALDVLREGALRLGLAREPFANLQKVGAGPDPALAAIAASRAAEAAVIAFHARDDDGPMSPEQFDEEKRLCAAQVATRETAWKTPPTTQAGRHALVDFARFQVERHTGHTGKLDVEEVLPEILDAMAAMVEAEGIAAALGPDAEALALVDAIEREWSASAHLLDARTPTDAATGAALARREALLDAADRLPATSRAARHAKAMALAWIASTNCPTEGVPHSSYATDAGLAFDIAASLTGGAPVAAAPPQAVRATSPGSDLDLSGCSIPDIARLYEVLRATSDGVSNALHVPAFSGADDGWTPAGLILDAEVSRLNRMSDACGRELTQRIPMSVHERDDRLCSLIAHEIACEGRIRDAALMRDLVRAWGGAGHTATEAGR